MAPDPEAHLLETLVRRELSGLRPPAAPPTLLPRIMAAVQAWASRPWYQRAWFTWPVAWQVAALLLLASFAAGVILSADAATAFTADALGEAVTRLGSSLAPLAPLATMKTAMVALSVLARALLEPAIAYRAYTFPIVVAMGAACAALAAALQRISAERTQAS